MLKVYATLGGLAIAFFLGWSINGKLVQAKWTKADNAALKEQIELTNDAISERDELQTKVNNALFRLGESETSRITLSNRLQEEINREPIVDIRYREVPADCPVCSFPVVDTVAHFRLWNDALTLTLEADTASLTTGLGYGALWGCGITASLDGSSRRID